MNGLPHGWNECALEDVSSDICYGYTAKSNPTAGDARMLRITDIQDNKVDWSTVPFCEISESEKDKYLLRKWDLVFARTGATVGKSFLIREAVTNSVFASYLIRVRLLENEMAGYLSRFFDSHAYWSQITEFSAGIGQPNVNGSKLKSLRVPLAPLAEQKRIADKLDIVLARVDACRERLNRIPLILKRFRQSVLAAAISGQLTSDWREKSGVARTWEPRMLRDLTTKVGSGATPKGGETAYKAHGIPLIRSMNVIFFGFKRDVIAYIDERQAHDLRNAEVRARDVLLNITGASIGRVTLAPGDFDGARVNQHVCIIRPTENLSPEYLCAYLASPDMQGFIGAENYGVTRQALTKQQILNFEIPLPRIDEQREIVHRIETLFSFADRLEVRMRTARDTTDRLIPALLAKAFRGELVPQDPNDEPAAELLKRLAAAREPVAQGKRSSKSAGKIKEEA